MGKQLNERQRWIKRINSRNKSKRGRNSKSLFLKDIKQRERVEGKTTKRRKRGKYVKTHLTE